MFSPPALFTPRNGTRPVALTPKDGFLYTYDRSSGHRLYRVAVNTQSNTDKPMSAEGVHFCPGTQSGAE